MFQLLIVDDEIHVVDRFTSTVPWSEVGVGEVYKAFSGPEALALLQQVSIDIVITDIQMPGMSGLQLIAEIKERWPKTKCILLSGHSDFSYAKEAILYQTQDYLLKPVREEDLLKTVKRVIGNLRQEWDAVVSQQRVMYTLKEHLPMLRSNLLNELLVGRKMSEPSLREKLRALELPDVHGGPFAMMMIRLEEYFLEYDPFSLSLMEYAIGNMVEELFGAKYFSWSTKDAHDYLVFTMIPKEASREQEDTAWFERTASLLQSAVHNYLKGKISILLSPWGRFPSDLSELYSHTVSAFRKRIGSDQEWFMRLEDSKLPVHMHSLRRLYEPPTLIHLLEAGRWEAVEEKLGAIFDDMEREFAESQEHLLEMYFSVASAYTYLAHKNGCELSEMIGVDYNKLLEGVPFRSVNQLREWSFRSLQRLKDEMDRETKYSRTSLIKDIQSFVEQNMSKDVSLQTIAEHVFLHPVYVSKVYKMETGDNLSDYVHRLRMDKAAHLLKHSQEKIYEIAAKLGYQRPHSFNHAFKKHYGITPQEYRDQYT